MGIDFLGDVGGPTGIILFLSCRWVLSMLIGIVVKTGVSFFACPATGQVSWDAPVGNFVCVIIMSLFALMYLICWVWGVYLGYLRMKKESGGS